MEVVDFYVGAAAPDVGAAGCGLRAVCSVQLGLRVAVSCSVVARVRAVVRRDGGPGRRCWRSARRGGVAQLDVGAAAPKLWQCWELRTSISCRVGDKVDLAQLVIFFSLLERPVATPPIVVTASTLRHVGRSTSFDECVVLCSLVLVLSGRVPVVWLYGFRPIFR